MRLLEMTSSNSSENKHSEFVPLIPLEESFEEDNNSLQYSSVQHSNNTSLVPSLSIVSDDHSTMPLSNDHPTSSSRDKPAIASQYKRLPAVVTSLVDPVLHNKFTRYLNGSFDTTLGYTTTDVTSDTDSVGHVVKPPPAENTDKMTHRRVDNAIQVPDKTTHKEPQSMTCKETQSVTCKETQSMTCKEAQRSTELDNLWKQFIVSPLYTDWVKAKRSPDAKAGMCYCEELKQIEYKSKHCIKLPVKHKVTTHHTTYSSSDNSTSYTDTGVQTSPSLLTVSTQLCDTSDAVLTDCPCVSSHVIKGSPPSSDNSVIDQRSCDVTGSCDVTESCEQPASLTELSLQEACRLFKKDFISNCRHRQRMIHHTRKQREEEVVINRHQAALADMARDYKSQYQNENSTTVTTNGIAAGKVIRPKMTARQMHEQTKRKWRTLPEVKQKQEEIKKKAAAAINRMNMKLYQQKVLHSLRKKF